MNITRRTALFGLTMAGLGASRPFRFAVCNETFEGASFADGCRLAKAAGYTGLEIAPGTLSASPVALTSAQRAQFRSAMKNEGLEFAGLHSLVSVPPGLHLTTPDKALRERSWEYFRGLIDLSADLGNGSVMVLGSGKQRATTGGSTVADARKRLTEGLAALAPHAQERKVLLLLEPLSPQFTDVVNTLAEAIALANEIGNPAVQSMFDTHNTVAETLPHDELIRNNIRHIRHVHVNELDGRHPGTGKYDFAKVLRALREVGYSGWISLEVFQFKPSGEAVAKEAMAVLRNIEQSLGGI